MPSLDDLGRAIRARRSYRLSFYPADVSEESIRACLDLARWAPSAHNAQPWRFVALFRQNPSHQAIRARMAVKMAERFETDMIGDGVASIQAKAGARASINRFMDAPVLIVACMETAALVENLDERRSSIESVMGTQSVAAAITILLVSLEASGLRSCWLCAPLFCEDVVREAIGLPATWRPQAFVLVGYGPVTEHPGMQKEGRMPGNRRQPVEDILFDPSSFINQRQEDQT
jgi:F420 biosynthesis protein FbiB-like protein